MSTPELRVDLTALNWTPADVTVPGVPAVAPGLDPMSLMISHFMPTVPVKVTEGVTKTRAREELFKENLEAAKAAYSNTDGAGEQGIQAAGDTVGPAGAAAATGTGAGSAGSAAGQMGQMGQMMGMPMQLAQQAAQIPMQVMGMAAAIPQGIMQGVQSAMQQVGQLSEMAGGGELDAEAELPEVETPELEQERSDEEPEEEREEEPASGSGASGGNAGGERAPEPAQPEPPREAAPPPAQTRPAESLAERML